MSFWLFSGIDGELGWKTVPPHERNIRVNPINPCSKKTRRLNEHGFIGFNGFYKWWSAGWKPVPSRARVTRDAVSGFITMKRRAVWKTVPPHKRSICVNPINPCSKKNSEEMKRTRIQRILSEMECSQKKTLSIHFLLPLKQIRHGNNRLDYIRISIPL